MAADRRDRDPFGVGPRPGDRGRAEYDMEIGDTTPVFVISVAARLTGMHPQTLRQYDRLGIVSPGRTAGRGRRYSARDISMLREVQRLSQEEGMNLAGIKRILELEIANAALRDEVRRLRVELEEAGAALRAGYRVFAAGPEGDIVAVRPGTRPDRQDAGAARNALVVWRPLRRG